MAVEAQRIEQRTNYDIEMMLEKGYTENELLNMIMKEEK